jgi:hypothetical protein
MEQKIRKILPERVVTRMCINRPINFGTVITISDRDYYLDGLAVAKIIYLLDRLTQRPLDFDLVAKELIGMRTDLSHRYKNMFEAHVILFYLGVRTKFVE